MPAAGAQRFVEVGDQAGAGEVDLDLAEQFGPDGQEHFLDGEVVGFVVDGLGGRLPGLFPARGEVVTVRVDPCYWIWFPNSVSGDVIRVKRPRRDANAADASVERCAIAHEIVHFEHRDIGTNDLQEERADRIAARRLIRPGRLEELAETDPAAIALELNVTEKIMRTYMRMVRQGRIRRYG